MNIHPSLKLFQGKQQDSSIQSIHTVEYKPVSQLNSSTRVLEFNVSGDGTRYVDMKNIKLKLTGHLEKADGKPASARETVANQLLHSLFSQVDVYLNQTLVTESTNTYAYKAYIDTLVKTTAIQKDHSLEASLYYADKAGKMDSVDILQNIGLLERHNRTKDRAKVEMVGRLNVDCFQTPYLLMPGVDIRVRLNKHLPSFYIFTALANSNTLFVIDDATLLVDKVHVNPTVLSTHSRMLERQKATYPFERTSMKTYTIAKDTQNVTLENRVVSQVPTTVLVGMVKGKAFAGHLASNPFNFQHFNVRSASLVLDGIDVPGEPFQLDFTTKKTATAFQALTDMVTQHYGISDAGIDFDMFNGGYTLLAFDLKQKKTQGSCAVKQGNLRLNLDFNSAVSESVTLLIYGTFHDQLEIDQNKTVRFQML